MKQEPVVQEAHDAIASLQRYVDEAAARVRALAGELSRTAAINTQEAIDFLREPWCILPKSRDEWWVVIPKWAGVQVGWLERATDTYNVFVVNRYSHWLGGIPEDLKARLDMPDPVQATVLDGRLKASEDVAAKVGKHLGKRDKHGYRVKHGHEFDLMADLVDLGSLPFTPRPVESKDLRVAQLQGPPAKLRPYQEEDWSHFLKYGAVGIYWPWGMGKTVLGAYAIAHLRERKLIVCPTRTVVEQWRERIRMWNAGLGYEVDVITYQGYNSVKDNRYTLAIFDEAHRLPANTFSRFATVPAKYRIGLSASPYREDGRTRYIFALTGWPLGVDWTMFLREGYIKKPDVQVQIVKGWREKCAAAERELRDVKGQVIIFCDAIDRGRALASRLDIPHVYSKTKDRLGILRKASAAVVSRVGDEGLSLPKLAKVVEIDFHGASRRQESQRLGRLMHANGKGQHIVLMTPEERDKCEGRFLALEEKGIKVNVREALR